MKTLAQYLDGVEINDNLKKIVLSLSDCIKEISNAVRWSDGKKVSTHNEFGEQQLAIDVAADVILLEAMKKTGVVGFVASEEVTSGEHFGDGKYSVVHDPLDGSSLVDVNFAVGTIVGIYDTLDLLGVTGNQQVASVVGFYGPRTAMFLTVGNGTHYFVLDENFVDSEMGSVFSPDGGCTVKGEFVLQKENLVVDKDAKTFAPGNLRACSEREDYVKLLDYWARGKYTLRYSGGMVPDVGHIMLKGNGIFCYPGYGEEADGKLRLLFECAPMAFLMEQAGGVATNGKVRILDIKVESFEQRTPIFIGSENEVARCMEFLG